MQEEDFSLWQKFIRTVIPLRAKNRVAPPSKPVRRVWVRRSDKGYVPPTLDLHGMIATEAYEMFLAFLKAHLKQGTRQITVITGKGKDGQGILKKEFPLWLENPFIADFIQSVSVPDRQAGGAYVIRLKQRKDKC